MRDHADNNVQLTSLQEVGEYSQDAILIIDQSEAKIVFSNATASRLLGLNKGDQLDKVRALFESVATPDREYVKNKFSSLLQQPTTTDVEFRLIDPSMTTIWLNCDVYLIDEGRFLYVVAQDITKKKQHEDYLVEYGAKKNTLLDTLMHQLNGSLMLMNNLALRAGRLNIAKDQEALAEFVSLVHNNSKHCIEIIDDLLKKEHTESPGIHVKFSRVDVVKVVNYIFEELRKIGSMRSIIFETTAPSIFAITDDVKLLQIVNNLASNAVKFTRERDEIRLSVHEMTHTVLISVSDTGIGIPEGLKPFIFEKHGPARRTGLNGERSIGLGLPICNHLTQLVGGRLWFESSEGSGTTFYLEIEKE